MAERLIPMCLGNALHGSKATWCWWDDQVVSSISGLAARASQIELELGKVVSYPLPQCQQCCVSCFSTAICYLLRGRHYLQVWYAYVGQCSE